MRPQIRKFINVCASSLELSQPIVEIGSKRHPSQEKLADLRTIFPGRTFIGCDMDAGPGVDRIENLEKLTFQDGEVGTFILCDTLEHVHNLDMAMKELARCLDPTNGVLIATSVMLFPVHGFPNDYWRFTPEGFRDLAKGFEWAATFYGGDPNFPHTVAFVACRQPPSQAKLDGLVKAVSKLTPVPHYADMKSEMLFSELGKLLLQQARSAGKKEFPVQGEMGTLSREGWVLSPGSWVKIALPPQPTSSYRIELKASGSTVQVIERADWNCLIGDNKDNLSETAFQFDPKSEIHSQVAQLEAYLMPPAGKGLLLARSSLGVLLPQTDLPQGLTLHSVDYCRIATDVKDSNAEIDKTGIKKTGIRNAEAARSLVRSLRDRGEKVALDLGCGFRKSGNIGIDATPHNTDADLICLLGFEPLPFEDSTVDEVMCRDFLEHIPKAVYLESKGRLHYPVMYLMDEIWRVLKPGGIFRSWTPMYPHPEVFQDPTHLSAWTIKSMDYFCGIYAGAKRIYKIQSCFEKIDVREEGFYLYAELKKPEQL